jgi:hypothetical protein
MYFYFAKAPLLRVNGSRESAAPEGAGLESRTSGFARFTSTRNDGAKLSRRASSLTRLMAMHAP